jgi:Uma2 family endonuclease
MTVATSLPPAPTFAPPTGQLKRFTVDEYHKMIQAGALDEDARFELLEGWIVYKVTKNPLHDMTVDLVHELLSDRVKGWRVRSQSAITTADSEPEPDVAVAEGPATKYKNKHPGPKDLALVVEVSDSSLDRDRDDKLIIYARAAIPVYWIVNLPDRVVEVYTDPSGPAARPTYRKTDTYHPNGSVPLSVAGQTLPPIPVRDILP